MITQSTKIHRFVALLKWLIALSAVWFMYHRLQYEVQRDWWGAFLLSFREGGSTGWFMIALVLIPVNWGLEALKWKRMMDPLEPVSFGTAFRAVLCGLVVSIFTPNRSGEYLGRVFVLERADRIAAVAATLGENFAQLLVTLTAGTIALFFFPPFMGTPLVGVPLWFLLVLVCILLTIVYFRSPGVIGWLADKRFLRRLRHRFKQVTAYSRRELGAVWLLAVARYLVFSFQFYALLLFFRVDLPVMTALACIAVFYFGLAMLPTFTLLEVGVRCSTAEVVFSGYTEMTEQVMFAASLLWLINILVPSLIGSLFVYRLRIVRSS